MNIGIWGLYDKGNFGDDLMALMFANYLTDKNYNIILYGASEFLSEEIGAKSESNIDRFTSQCDLIIIGGGGMLVNNALYKIILKKTEYLFEYSFFKLFKSLKKYNKKIIPMSIGGGNADFLNNPFKKRIFSSDYTIEGTVRLKSDLKAINKDIFSYVPDIVLTASEIIKRKKTHNSKPRILLNLKIKNSSELIRELEELGFFEKYDIFSFGSHATSHSNFATYEYRLENRHLSFSTVKEAIDIISQSDLIISSKLHVGVAGLSYNVPFISFKGPEKAKLFLKEVKMETFICDNSQDVIDLLNSWDSLSLMKGELIQAKTTSEKHFEILNESIKNIKIANTHYS